ncbi:MAG: NAD-dependent DNA ligase LigA, partial [Acidimicrobiia bacterium]|nr:NAD-dependent DNA ligase LigA [Acidimicrobiia bacterium]
VGPITSARTGAEQPWEMPSTCPFCDAAIVRPEGEKVARCTRGLSCPSRLREWLFYFSSRSGMDIEGMGYQTIDLLVSEGLIEDPAGIFFLRPDHLMGREGWGDLSVNNLMEAINVARHRPIARLLAGLGIRHVGATMARLLAREFGSLEALADAGEETLAAVDGVGPVIAQSVTEWFSEEDNRRLLTRMGEAGVQLADPDRGPGSDQTLEGVSLVVTGSLSSMSRSEARQAVEARGGRLVSSVSKTTSALVAGEKPGSKLAKAEALGIPVIDESTLERLIEEGPGVLLNATPLP